MKEYFAKNRLWMTPAIGGSLATAMPVLLMVIGGPNVDAIPSWGPLVPLSLTVIGTVAGATQVDTMSASVVRFFGSAGLFAEILYWIFK